MHYGKRFFNQNRETTVLSIPFLSSGADISGNLLNANNYGSVSFTTPVSGVANLGDGKYFIVPNSDLLSFTDGVNDKPFSIEFKMKGIRAISSNILIFLLNKRTSSNALGDIEYQIYLDYSTGTLCFNCRNGVEQSAIAVSVPFTPSSTVERALKFTYDGSKLWTGLKIYVDDVLQPMTNISVGTYTGMVKSPAPLMINVYGLDLTSGELSGYIKDLIIKTVNPNVDKLTVKDGLSLRIERQSFPSTTRTTWFDMSGLLNNGITTNVTYDSTAVLFNGTSATTGFGTTLNPALNNFSINVICKINTNGVTNVICSKGNQASSNIGFALFKSSADNKIVMRVNGDNTSIQRADVSVGPITDTNYHMYTLVIDRTNNTLRGYLDGVESFTTTTQLSIAGFGSITNATTLRFGSLNGTPFSYLNGGIKSALIYNNKALTQQEVTTLYNTMM